MIVTYNMNRAESYKAEIESLKCEMTRLRKIVKELLEQKKIKELHLYNHMKRNDIEKVGKISIKSITPKGPAIPKKNAAQKKGDAIKLFYEIGAPDPEQLWRDYQKTQKHEVLE